MSRKFLAVFTILFTITALSPTLSLAAEPKDETIKELLKAMKTKENIESSLKAMKDNIKMNDPYFIKEIKIILARELEEKDVQTAAEAYRKDSFGAQRLYEIFREKLDLDKLAGEVMVPVYKEHYSEEEVKKLITFYNSELGQKTLQLTPKISKAIGTQMRDASQVALNRAKEDIAKELIKSLKK